MNIYSQNFLFLSLVSASWGLQIALCFTTLSCEMIIKWMLKNKLIMHALVMGIMQSSEKAQLKRIASLCLKRFTLRSVFSGDAFIGIPCQEFLNVKIMCQSFHCDYGSSVLNAFLWLLSLPCPEISTLYRAIRASLRFSCYLSLCLCLSSLVQLLLYQSKLQP